MSKSQAIQLLSFKRPKITVVAQIARIPQREIYLSEIIKRSKKRKSMILFLECITALKAVRQKQKQFYLQVGFHIQMAGSTRTKRTHIPSTPTSPITPSTPLTPSSALTSTRRRDPTKKLQTYLIKPFKFVQQRVLGWFHSIGVSKGDPVDLKSTLTEGNRKRIEAGRDVQWFVSREQKHNPEGMINRRCCRKLTVFV